MISHPITKACVFLTMLLVCGCFSRNELTMTTAPAGLTSFVGVPLKSDNKTEVRIISKPDGRIYFQGLGFDNARFYWNEKSMPQGFPLVGMHFDIEETSDSWRHPASAMSLRFTGTMTVMGPHLVSLSLSEEEFSAETSFNWRQVRELPPITISKASEK